MSKVEYVKQVSAGTALYFILKLFINRKHTQPIV